MDAIEEQFKFKPSRSPSVPGVGLCGKKSGDCRLKAIGSDQSAGCWSAKQERQMSLIVGLVQFPVAGSVGAQLNVWRLTLSAALVCLLPTG